MSGSPLDVCVTADRGVDARFVLDARGVVQAAHENAARLVRIRQGLARWQHTCFIAPSISDADSDALVAAVHDARYVAFLAAQDALAPDVTRIDEQYSAPGVRPDSPVMRGVYRTARAGASTAATVAARLAAGTRYAYALCRPPGHHAGPAWMGGYCYINNAVLVVHQLQRSGFPRIGVIDIDFHFGNGTAALLAARPDVSFGSVHASTVRSYPYVPTAPRSARDCFISFEEPPSAAAYVDSVAALVAAALTYRPDALVVSVGFDVIAGDPHGGWDLPPEVFEPVGRGLASTGLPVGFVQEGGYRLDAIGDCAYYLARGLCA